MTVKLYAISSWLWLLVICVCVPCLGLDEPFVSITRGIETGSAQLTQDVQSVIRQFRPSRPQLVFQEKVIRNQMKAAINEMVAASKGAQRVANTLSTNPNDIRFFLYNNRRNTDIVNEIRLGDVDGLHRVRNYVIYAQGRQLKVLIHGFRGDLYSDICQVVKDAYLDNGDYDVICVDWSALARPRDNTFPTATLQYPYAAGNVRRAGERVADFIMFLYQSGFIFDFESVHIIGFSLGAHVAGVAGRVVQFRTEGSRLGRITGLDPAGPEFYSNSASRRLDAADAIFVDVVHTNAGINGHPGDLGAVDFFVNGGIAQPFCHEDNSDKNVFTNIARTVSGACSHNRATKYFVQSIRDPSIFACQCESWIEFMLDCGRTCRRRVPFGENTPYSSRGRYFLEIDA